MDDKKDIYIKLLEKKCELLEETVKLLEERIDLQEKIILKITIAED